MNADEHRSKLDSITERVIGCAYDVANQLGAGFLEKVYENALAHELRKSGLIVRQQHGILVKYDGIVVGEFVADILVEDCILVELKAVKDLDDAHMAQCMNYLKATSHKICLLINFGNSRVQIERIANKF